jgi:uncharacterized metal-binding protein YceD (DUF177 family)
MSQAWTTPVRLHELARGPLVVRLEPDEAERAKLAHDVGLETLPSLTAELTLKPWLDGVEITGRFDAVVEQICAVTLDPFEHALSGEIEVRAVPEGSPHAPADRAGELEYDPDQPDPPDVLAGDAVDLAAYVAEHLALEVDPFARKPGAAFEYASPEPDDSPFAALQKLRDKGA